MNATNSRARRRLLIIAYHFPPIQGSTGTSRTIAFSKYLQTFGWDVCVLTVRSSAYEDVSSENEKLIPRNIRIERAWGLDTRRHLSFREKYPMILAIPDRWQSWVMGGSISGARLLRQWQPDVIMSTYPIPSAHLIGLILHKTYNVPWVAEFRDPMLQDDYPHARLERWSYREIERRVFERAKSIIVTTDSCRAMYLERYPQRQKDSIVTISNGFDPDLFDSISVSSDTAIPEKLSLLHSGLLYPDDRDPLPFFHAVRSLKDRGVINGDTVQFNFRACGNEEDYQRLIKTLEISSVVRILPRLPYTDAIRDMAHADALMIFQSSSCNAQIPAKLYEYMRCRRPILALTDPDGATGRLLRSIGVNTIARLENQSEIEATLEGFLQSLTSGDVFIIKESDVQQFSREALTRDLHDLLLKTVSA